MSSRSRISWGVALGFRPTACSQALNLCGKFSEKPRYLLYLRNQFFIATHLLFYSLINFSLTYHEMAVADTTNQLLKEIPRLDRNNKFSENTVIQKKNIYIYKYKINKKLMKTSSSLNRPAVHIRSKSSPPAAYSIAIARCVGVSTT